MREDSKWTLLLGLKCGVRGVSNGWSAARREPGCLVYQIVQTSALNKTHTPAAIRMKVNVILPSDYEPQLFYVLRA